MLAFTFLPISIYYKLSPLPQSMYHIIDLNQDASKLSPYISETLLSCINFALHRGEKSLLYINSRGSHKYVLCEDCHYLWNCENCDSSMHVHGNPLRLVCHQCQSSSPYPLECPNCHGSKLKNCGTWTQQIEDLMTHHFKNAKIFRFDSDSLANVTAKKWALEKVQRADIIIGTKILSTWFNFPKLGCIGVILVEQELQHPCYDGVERSYAQIRQLIWRGNRGQQKTEICLQSLSPKNRLISHISSGNFKWLLNSILTERKQFGYPPYGNWVKIELREESKEKSLQNTKKLWNKLISLAQDWQKILIWNECFKKNRWYYSSILLRGEKLDHLLSSFKKELLQNPRIKLTFL